MNLYKWRMSCFSNSLLDFHPTLNNQFCFFIIKHGKWIWLIDWTKSPPCILRCGSSNLHLYQGQCKNDLSSAKLKLHLDNKCPHPLQKAKTEFYQEKKRRSHTSNQVRLRFSQRQGQNRADKQEVTAGLLAWLIRSGSGREELKRWAGSDSYRCGLSEQLKWISNQGICRRRTRIQWKRRSA